MVASEVRDTWPKPLDVGNGQVCASFAVDGSWLSLGCVHPRHGFVEFTGAPAFDQAWRGQPDAVRRHRHELTLARHAALRLTGAVPVVVPDPHRPGRPRWSGRDRAGRHEAEAWAAAAQPGVVQRHIWRAGPDLRPRRLALVVPGRIERPPFAEITEVSPLPPLPCRASATAEGTVLHVTEPALPAVARVRVTVAGGVTSGWRIDARTARLPISWDPRQEPTLELTIACALAPENPLVPDGRRPPEPRRPEAGPLSTRLHVPARLRPRLSSLIDGVLDYILGCTALTVTSGERCILTDHRLLQLSWTRDAYYQALLLLAARHIEPRALTVVAEHLRWLWGRCDRARTAGHAATCQMVPSRIGRSRPTSSSTLSLSCSTTGRWPGRGPSLRRVGATGAKWSPRPGGHCQSTPNSASSPARRILRTIRHPCRICCPRRSCSGTRPPGCSPARVSSALTPGRSPAPRTPREQRSGTASPALARSAPSGRTRPTVGGVPPLPRRQRPPDRPCAAVGTVPTRGRGMVDHDAIRPRPGEPGMVPGTMGRPRLRPHPGLVAAGRCTGMGCREPVGRDRPRGARARAPPCRGRAGRSPPRDLRLGHRYLAGPPLVRLAERGPRRPRPRRRGPGGPGDAS